MRILRPQEVCFTTVRDDSVWIKSESGIISVNYPYEIVVSLVTS
jgi:hypothetical protein